MANKLSLENIGPIKKAEISFGDLTIFVGPQASGKSIALQWMKLALDRGVIQRDLVENGLDWSKSSKAFMDVYFGEGLRSLWGKGSSASWNGKSLAPEGIAARRGKGNKESVFLIPAQRVLALTDGWPRHFRGYAAGDPYVVRAFSERLRLIMEQEFKFGEALFPKLNRLKSDYRDLLQQSVFAHFSLTVGKELSQKRLVLQDKQENELPYMVWSAGQREFVPLLLGVYWLMPAAKITRREAIQWVVIEEPEMGLHPRAVSAVLALVLELLYRGYRVCISTHSTQVLEFAWAMARIAKFGGQPNDLLSILAAPATQSLRHVAKDALKSKIKAYYFENGAEVVDISSLDPSSSEDIQASWGGLVESSARANEVVARTMASALIGRRS